MKKQSKSKFYKKLGIAFTASLLLVGLAACTTSGKSSSTSSSSAVKATATSTGSYSSVADAISKFPTTAKTGDTSGKSSATKSYDLASGSVTITAAGTYYITGSSSNAQIIVKAPSDAKVTIILNGVNLTSTSGAAIKVETANKVTVESAKDSVNLVKDSANNSDNAAIKAEADLDFKGDGTLAVTGTTAQGISTSDDVDVKNGSLFVRATNNGITGKDSVTFEGGSTIIDAKGKSVKSDQDNGDTTKSIITVKSGNLYLNAGSEGMEAATIDIEGGETNITSGDDAINASSTVLTPVYKQSGGTVSFVSGGDGVDSNGSTNITGGTMYAIENSTSDNEPIDSDNTPTISNFTLIAGGTNNAWSANSSQSYILVGSVKSGDKVTIDGVGTFTAPADMSNMIVSTSKVTSGTSYKVTTGSTTTNVTAGQGADTPMGVGGGPGGGTPNH